MMSQLKFMEFFVHDILDLRSIRDSVFRLNPEVFDFKQTLDLVCDIFSPQASAKNIKINTQLVKDLDFPDSSQSIQKFVKQTTSTSDSSYT